MCQVLCSVRDSEARSLQSRYLDHVCMPPSMHTKTKYDSSITTVTIIRTQGEFEVWIIPVGYLWQTVGRFSLKVFPLLSEHIGRQHSSTFFAVRSLSFDHWIVSGSHVCHSWMRFLKSGFSFSTPLIPCRLAEHRGLHGSSRNENMMERSWASESYWKARPHLYCLVWTLCEQVIYLCCLSHTVYFGACSA